MQRCLRKQISTGDMPPAYKLNRKRSLSIICFYDNHDVSICSIVLTVLWEMVLGITGCRLSFFLTGSKADILTFNTPCRLAKVKVACRVLSFSDIPPALPFNEALFLRYCTKSVRNTSFISLKWYLLNFFR